MNRILNIEFKSFKLVIKLNSLLSIIYKLSFIKLSSTLFYTQKKAFCILIECKILCSAIWFAFLLYF